MHAAEMNAEAARCFKRACEADDSLDQTIFISLRQAWLVLAQQVEQRARERQRIVLPEAALNHATRAETQPRSAPSKRRRKQTTRQKASANPRRTRRRKLAA